jgi:hypothetical protein
MDTLFGLPAHPFLVHIPIVLLPLSAVGVLLMALRPQWHQRYRWVVLAIGTVGVLGAVVAASAGEELEGRIVAVEGRRAAASWEHHASLGDTARSVALVYFALLALFVLVPSWLERRAAPRPAASVGAAASTPERPSWQRLAVVGVTVLALAGAAGSVASIIAAGHTGSRSVWHDYVRQTGGH